MKGRRWSTLTFFCGLLVFSSPLALAQEAQRGRLIHAEIETELVPSPAKFDVLLPPNYETMEKPLPIVIWLHGGGGGGR